MQSVFKQFEDIQLDVKIPRFAVSCGEEWAAVPQEVENSEVYMTKF